MRTAAVAAALALGVSGCDDGRQSRDASSVQSIEVRSEAQKQLHEASDLNRAIALKRAIYDSGYRCQRITSSGYVADYRNLEMWMAKCADGRDWAIFIGPDGSAQVRDCKDVAEFGLPECEIKDGEGAGARQADEA